MCVCVCVEVQCTCMDIGAHSINQYFKVLSTQKYLHFSVLDPQFPGLVTAFLREYLDFSDLLESSVVTRHSIFTLGQPARL